MSTRYFVGVVEQEPCPNPATDKIRKHCFVAGFAGRTQAVTVTDHPFDHCPCCFPGPPRTGFIGTTTPSSAASFVAAASWPSVAAVAPAGTRTLG